MQSLLLWLAEVAVCVEVPTPALSCLSCSANGGRNTTGGTHCVLRISCFSVPCLTRSCTHTQTQMACVMAYVALPLGLTR